MAERDVIIRIRAIDQASAVFNRVALAAGAFVSYWALQRGVRVATEAFIEAESTSITLAAALRATGNAAGFTTDELEAYADELMRLTTVDDEAFKRIMGIMATFRNVSGEVFKESIELIADMSVQFGGLESGAIRLGKALNDPVTGMSALSRVGIQFSETQKETIKRLVEQNDLMGAQKIILAELTNQFGGQARAQVDSFGGAIDQLKNAFGEWLKDVGGMITEIPYLIESIRVATVVFENFGLAQDMVWTSARLSLVTFQEDFNHLFTTVLPDIGQWFFLNFADMLITLESFLGSIFENIARNAWNAIQAIKGWQKFEWTPLLDGFENTVQKFPEIAKRAMTDVEKELMTKQLEMYEKLKKMALERLAAIRDSYRTPGEPFGPDAGAEAAKAAGRKRADLVADESRFLAFGRVAGDAAKEAAREAKRAARIAQDQRARQERQLERIARRAEMETGPGDGFFLNSWAGLFAELLGKGGTPGMIAPVKSGAAQGDKTVRLAEKADRARDRQEKKLGKLVDLMGRYYDPSQRLAVIETNFN